MPREKKTVAKSFRIDEDALEMLRDEAQYQKMSLNTLVNQLVVNYANFGRYAKRVHTLVLSRETVSELISPLTEDEIAKAGQNSARDIPREWMLLVDGKIAVSSVIHFIHNLSSYTNWFEYTEKNQGEHWTITLMHEMGRKWSLFIAHHINAAFAAAGCQPKYDIADQYVTFAV